MSDDERAQILEIVDALEPDDARFLVMLLAQGQASLALAVRDIERLRRRNRNLKLRLSRPTPTIGMN